MAKGGRPPTPEDEQLVTVIRLMNKHVAILDRVIRERSERDLNCVISERETTIPGTNVTVTNSRTEGLNYATERRKLVAEIIEQALTPEALYPTSVGPNVPPGPYSNVQLVGISAWAEKESRRLTENAPPAVQLVLERNKLRKMERELPQKEFLERLRAATGAAKTADDGVITQHGVPKGELTSEETTALTTDDDENP